MKRVSMILIVVALALGTSALAEDGAALFKAKCAGCHGAEGQGKIGPAIKGNPGAADVLMNGGKKGPHAKPMAGITADQAKAIGDYVASLK
jgi:mono/diheme cytochrome c family protein